MVCLNTTTALLLDHKLKQVKFVEYDGTLEQLYEYVGCDLVDTVRLDKRHIAFVDDEGLFKEYSGGFIFGLKGGKYQEIVGNALIVGDYFGETTSIKFDPSDLIIQFVSYERPQEEKNV